MFLKLWAFAVKINHVYALVYVQIILPELLIKSTLIISWIKMTIQGSAHESLYEYDYGLMPHQDINMSSLIYQRPSVW